VIFDESTTVQWFRVGIGGVVTVIASSVLLLLQRYIARKDAEDEAERQADKHWRRRVDAALARTERNFIRLKQKYGAEIQVED
jgi:hypothetical protein